MSSRDNGRARVFATQSGSARVAVDGQAPPPTAAESDGADGGASSGNGSSLFREVNERIRELEGERAIGEYDFVCECEDDTCTGTIRMTAQQYEEVRAAANRFAVLPGHQRSAIEEVLSRSDGHVVVAKRSADGTRADGVVRAGPSNRR